MPDRVEDGRQLMNPATAVQQAAKFAARRHLSARERALIDRLKVYDDNFTAWQSQAQRTGEEAV